MDSEDTKLYQTLGIDATNVDVLGLSEREIGRFYRKAALKWHPDKNPGDERAASKFSEIFVAYETLTEPKRRKEYDAAICAVRLQRKQFEQLDAGRRKMKEDLRRREQSATISRRGPSNLDAFALKRMQAEIERLRREAAKEERVSQRDIDNPEDSEMVPDGGLWENVRGYALFKTKGAGELDFVQFENAVVSGHFAESTSV